MVSDLSSAFAKVGTSVEEAAEAFQKLSACIGPFTEDDIQLVRMNPSLSPFEKFKIIRAMRKSMRGK